MRKLLDGLYVGLQWLLTLLIGVLIFPVTLQILARFTDLVPNYKTVSSFLKNGDWNSVNGQMYGIPHGWGANLLMWDTKRVSGNLAAPGFPDQ